MYPPSRNTHPNRFQEARMRLDSQPAAARAFFRRAALPLAAALALSACAGMSDSQPHAARIEASALGLGADGATAPTVQEQWWREFDDAQLDRLIDSALASNPSLKVAQARLARAQASADITDAAGAAQGRRSCDGRNRVRDPAPSSSRRTRTRTSRSRSSGSRSGS